MAVFHAYVSLHTLPRIRCGNGRTIGITASVADIFSALLCSQAAVYFWITLLYINQQDLQEKLGQALISGRLCASAKVWLSRSPEDSDVTLGII